MNLTQADIRFLCTALGFTAVAMQSKNQTAQDSAARAAAFADLIEEFCRTNLPEMSTIAPAGEASPSQDA